MLAKVPKTGTVSGKRGSLGSCRHPPVVVEAFSATHGRTLVSEETARGQMLEEHREGRCDWGACLS